MVGFVGRWLSDALRIGASLAVGLAAMQLPAVAHQYGAALLQIAEDGRRDIEQRKASARHFYPTMGETDEDVITGLRPVEPSNAQALAASVERARVFRAAYDRLEATAPLMRPVTAAIDAVDNAQQDKQAVLWTALKTHVPEVLLSTAAAIYGLAGLVVGSFMAEVLLSAVGALVGRRSSRQFAR
jgi:hypothetical protein